jgi:hypothetical protein
MLLHLHASSQAPESAILFFENALESRHQSDFCIIIHVINNTTFASRGESVRCNRFLIVI